MPASARPESSVDGREQMRLVLHTDDGLAESEPARYLCINPLLHSHGLIETDALSSTTERHAVTLPEVCWKTYTDAASLVELAPADVQGVILVLNRGWLRRAELRTARIALQRNLRAFVYWPDEQAVEVLDEERLKSFRNLWVVRQLYQSACQPWVTIKAAAKRRLPEFDAGTRRPNPAREAARATATLIRNAQPVGFSGTSHVPTADRPIPGCGVYLRTDYWAPITSGGSYAHTCYVAKALSRVTEKLVCFMAHRFPMLDELGSRVQQIPMEIPCHSSTETDLLRAPQIYRDRLKLALETLQPAYLYERFCLGNYTAAQLSLELGIPYILEYNGSECSLKRSFDERGFQHESEYLAAEQAAFQQAAVISVVSEPIRDGLIGAGVDPERIIVLPNAADPEDYAPPTEQARRELKQSFGWDDGHCVVGFTGTFGGWHGIDVLARAMPQIAARAPGVRFLLIGDGQMKPLIDESIRAHGLENVVHCTGRVPQAEGRRLLGACNLFVSPHDRHMVDSRFFGSPTKLFEYMAMGGCIVASDLEQIGEVLFPALRLQDLRDDNLAVEDQRAVLCRPGDVGELVEAVVMLARQPERQQQLGRNARQAVLDDHSWDRRAEQLWHFTLSRQTSRDSTAVKTAAAGLRIETGDSFKNEVQNQWDENPCGSHYVKDREPHTLEWYLDVERYRYKEYAPWMPKTMEFQQHRGRQLLEIGGGLGTDLAQFAAGGAIVTDIDLSAGHLSHARENFALRSLTGRFIHHDAETLPFENSSFDVVYSNGVIHHTPNTQQTISEIYRVLKPGGKAIVMVYAENSLHYWRQIVGRTGMQECRMENESLGGIMSECVEMTANGARPLVKVYTAARLRQMFSGFERVSICRRQLTRPELPPGLRWLPTGLAGRVVGWNLIVKARK